MNTSRAPRTGRRRSAMRRAFTLIELLVVITIIAIGTVLLVPAFGRITASVNYTGSVNSVVATLSSARTLAIREGRHTAVAFLWDEEDQQMSLQILIQQAGLGSALTEFPSGSASDIYAFAYSPAIGQTPVVLPKGTLIYGLSRAVADERTKLDSNADAWYAGHYLDTATSSREPVWLFPRNDPAWATIERGGTPPNARLGVDPWDDLASGDRRLDDVQFTNAVRNAQTFCVQYSPDGAVVNSPSAGGITSVNAYIEYPDGPLDLDNQGDPDRRFYDNDRLFDPESALNASDPEPNPEVYLRSAEQIAIIELTRIRDRFGVEKPWHIEPGDATTRRPSWLDASQYFDNDRAEEVNAWIDANAEILGFNRYSGDVLRRTTR